MADQTQNVELGTFIANTSREIASGVRQAAQDVGDLGGEVNPDTGFVERVSIEFDLVVTASASSGSKAGIGVVSGVFGIGARGESMDSHTINNRIKFAIPLGLPQGKHIHIPRPRG